MLKEFVHILFVICAYTTCTLGLLSAKSMHILQIVYAHTMRKRHHVVNWN